MSECDKEPIRLIGAIQAHGWYLAFRLRDRTIHHASQNIHSLTQKSAREILNQALGQIFCNEVTEALISAAQKLSLGKSENLRLQLFKNKNDLYDILLYDWDGLIAVEIEQLANAHAPLQATAYSQQFVEALQECRTLVDGSKELCRIFREMADFDRVMMYRYLPNWDGEVIAEDKAIEAHSFLHHRFPASDIPLPARDLYLQNRTRQIVDSASAPVVLEPDIHYLTRKRLDLSASKLRAVAPVHLEYLQNMGVKTSFSVAIVVEQKLWGLVACHGSRPAIIPHDIRAATEIIASAFAVFAKNIEAVNAQSDQIRLDKSMKALLKELRGSRDPLAQLFQMHTTVEEIFSASGIALATLNTVQIAGQTLPTRETRELADTLRQEMQKTNRTSIAIESLTTLDERWKNLSSLCSGVLATLSPDSDGALFLIFRGEVPRTTVWGGDPRKNLEKRNYKGSINPRNSFDGWVETIMGHCLAWRPFELQGAEFLRDFVFDGLARKELLIQQLGKQIAANHNP